MSIFLRDTRTGIITVTNLVEPQLGLYLRENTDIVKVGIATTANANYYPFLSESTVDRKDPYVSSNLTFNPSTGVLGIGSLSLSPNSLTGINTISLSGPLYDSVGSKGASGQILSSTGNATSWINASTTNVGSATSVGINLDSTNTSRNIVFTDRTSGNGYIQVDTDITYNPSTNTLSGVNLNFSGSSTITTLSVTTSSITNDNGTNLNFTGIGTIVNARGTNLNYSGIVTASTFVGNLTNTLTLNTSGTGLSGSTTFNNSGAATFTVTSNATSANTVSTIVARDASGNFSAGTITATTFSGSGASLTSIPNSALSNSTISGVSLGANLNTLTLNTSGTGLSGSTTYNGSSGTTFTVTSNATNSKIGRAHV